MFVRPQHREHRGSFSRKTPEKVDLRESSLPRPLQERSAIQRRQYRMFRQRGCRAGARVPGCVPCLLTTVQSGCATERRFTVRKRRDPLYEPCRTRLDVQAHDLASECVGLSVPWDKNAVPEEKDNRRAQQRRRKTRSTRISDDVRFLPSFRVQPTVCH